jgi:hypothetical protein
MPEADPIEVLRRARQAVSEVAGRSSGRAILKLLADAEDDLEKRLKKRSELVPFGDGSFTSHQMRVTLAQIRDVTKSLVRQMGPEIADDAVDAAGEASDHVAEFLRASERKFNGIASTLPIEDAAMASAAVAGTRASVLRRLMVEHPDGKGGGILQRYGFSVVENFERQLAVAVATRKPFDEVRDALLEQSPFLQGASRSWAERIARTELHGAYGRGAHEAMKAAEPDIGVMFRILVATFDDRTGCDSYNVHGEVRRMNEPFEYVDYEGEHEEFMTPPNRPNDREIVVAHAARWPIPKSFAPKTDGEVKAAYARARQKYHGRPRVMSTVDLKKIAREPPRAGSLEEMGIAHEFASSPRTKANVEEGIRRGGFEEHLRRSPLDGGFGEHPLSLDSPAGDAHPMANGLYSWGRGPHTISMLDREGFGKRFEAKEEIYAEREAKRAAAGKPPRERKLGPDIHSVSSMASTPDEMQQRTTVHELSHHLHLADLKRKRVGDKWVIDEAASTPLSLKVDGMVKKAFRHRTDGAEPAWTVSKYALANHKEWFAETHAAYVFHPKRLRKKDPEAYALMRKIRKMRGIS